MKRSRDEVYSGPPFKRPFGSMFSRAEPYGTSQAPPVGGGSLVNGGNNGASADAAGGTQKLTTNDALSYLKQVKDMFQDQKGKYDCFLDVMKDFKAQRIDTASVIGRVKDLFKGHPNLILGFNTFLPKGYEISLSNNEQVPPKRTVEFEEAISFVNKIKKRFQNDDRIYKSFLDILNMYRKEHKSTAEVYREVAALFCGHTDLLDEFRNFLPDSSSTTAPFQGSAGHHSHRYDERSSAFPMTRHTHTDKQQLKDSPGERDLSVERPNVEEEKTIMKLHKEQKKHAERENRSRRNRDLNDQDLENENQLEVNEHRFSEKRKSAKNANSFAGTAKFSSLEDRDALKCVYRNEFLFCEKVKERLHSADDYQDFLKCLHLYSKEIISRHELQDLVATIIGKYHDLLESFHEFMERCEHIDGLLPAVMGKKSLWSEGNSSKLLRTEDQEKEHKREGESGKSKERFNSKHFGKSIQELDLSNSECCTPSYRLLPDDYPICSASQRSNLGNQVLNDKWVSVTSGSEDYSFKHMRRNQYEESLFRCEDDRFELDMLLESVSSTSKRAEELLKSITDNSMGIETPIRISDHFTANNLRCIERLYGDHGLDVMEILRKNASLALPVILTRLKQRQEEWTKCRADFNKVWAEIYQKNHYKTLDHRSFYFKQQDSKNLSTKSLVAEIKEMKEKIQKEDEAILSIATGSRHSRIPHMEFEYVDDDVHDDVFRIIKYSCEEICSTEDQLHKVLRLWTHFFEPILGIRSRPLGMDTTGDSGPKYKVKMKLAGVLESEDVATDTILKDMPTSNEDSATSSQNLNFNTVLETMDVGVKDGQEMTSGEIHDAANTSRTDVKHVSGEITAHCIDGDKGNANDRVSSEGAEMLKVNQFADAELGNASRPMNHEEDSVDPCTAEKEEGELSPNSDLVVDYSALHQEVSCLEALHELNETNQARMGVNEDTCAEPKDKNDVDADDENSENISVGGEDASGTESSSDDCSREDEEEEDGEHNDLECKAESEGETEIDCGTHYYGGDRASPPLSEQYLLTCKPICKHVSSPLPSNEMKQLVLYGNDTLYVLFRLHQTLYERISFAKLNSISRDSRLKMTKDASSDPNARFMGALFSLLDGSSDNTKFEDNCRSLIGNQSYVLFTMEKLIYKLVKQLQIVSNDEACCKLFDLYDYEKSRKPQKFVDSVYHENVRVLLHEENVYRLECTYNPTRLSIQLMHDENEKSDVVPALVDPSFATYLQYDYLPVNHETKNSSSAVMRKRNTRKYHNLDETSALRQATESTRTMNGLECKMASASSKVSYVIDTGDYFIRIGRRKNGLTDERSQARIAAATQRFHEFLERS